MCLPLLGALGSVVSAMGGAGAAASAIGTGISALQAAAASRYQANVAEQNARLQSQAGNDAAMQGQRQAAQLYRKLGQTEGTQNAQMAANGLDLNFGSPLAAQRDTAALGAEDARSLYDQTAQNVRGFDINAAGDRAKATGARMDATRALTKGVFDSGLGGSILGKVEQFKKLVPPKYPATQLPPDLFVTGGIGRA